MNVVPGNAGGTGEFEGKKYFCCAKACAEKFRKEPRRYLSAKVPTELPAMGHEHGGGLVSIGGTAPAEQSQRPSRKMASTTEKRAASVATTSQPATRAE